MQTTGFRWWLPTLEALALLSSTAGWDGNGCGHPECGYCSVWHVKSILTTCQHDGLGCNTVDAVAMPSLARPAM